MDPDSIGWSLLGFLVLIAMTAVFVWLYPVMGGTEGSIITFEQSETRIGETTVDGNSVVVILSSLWSGITLLTTTLCSGGFVGWIILTLVALGVLVGIAAHS